MGHWTERRTVHPRLSIGARPLGSVSCVIQELFSPQTERSKTSPLLSLFLHTPLYLHELRSRTHFPNEEIVYPANFTLNTHNESVGEFCSSIALMCTFLLHNSTVDLRVIFKEFINMYDIKL